MEAAIQKRDFETFANLTMVDSDDFHAVCADTDPPIYYMNETSKRVVQMITGYNKFRGKACVRIQN